MMTNRLLKQEEIDALLNAQGPELPGPEGQGPETAEQPLPENVSENQFHEEESDSKTAAAELREERPVLSEEALTDSEKDALGEIGNICMGSASTTLSMLISQKVNITSPRVVITNLDVLFKGFETPHMSIHVRFIEGISGYNLLIMNLQDVAILADLMMGGDGENITEELSEIGSSAASEAMNQMIGSASTAMATMFGRTVNISPPETKIYQSADELKPAELGHSGPVVVVWFKMTVGNILDTQIMQVMGIDTAREEAGLMLNQLFQLPPEEEPQGEYLPFLEENEQALNEENEEILHSFNVDEELQWTDTAITAQKEEKVQFTAVPGTAPAAAPPSLDQKRLNLILDIPLKVSVLLGRTRWPIKDILGLTPGSVVEMQSIVDEPVEVLVNGTLVAVGEVVVVNENFGVRITSIIGPEERLQNLRK